MSIEKISDAARDAASVGALADRPQATERDGTSGMTPAQLKAAFDALPKLNTAKINEIIDALLLIKKISFSDSDSDGNIVVNELDN